MVAGLRGGFCGHDSPCEPFGGTDSLEPATGVRARHHPLGDEPTGGRSDSAARRHHVPGCSTSGATYGPWSAGAGIRARWLGAPTAAQVTVRRGSIESSGTWPWCPVSWLVHLAKGCCMLGWVAANPAGPGGGPPHDGSNPRVGIPPLTRPGSSPVS